MSEPLRVRGERLDADDAYVDVVLDNYTIDNEVTLVEQANANPREWTVDATAFQAWRHDGDLLPHDEIDDPDAKMWSLIEEAHQLAATNTIPPEAGEVGKRAAADLFRAASKAKGKGQAPP